MEIIEGKVKKAEKAEIAKNLRRLGISIDIGLRTTGATELLF